MFPPSNSTYNDFLLTMPGSSFTVDKNSAVSSQDEPTHPFWQFPASFIDDADDGLLMSHLLSQAHQQILASSTNMAPIESEINPASPRKETKKAVNKRKRSSVSNGTKQGIPRKRAGKKDRHSKIYTAHGPRDRRMRLSLQIARKFFDLQDMLGFDKASKTIEWLFSKSKAAIKELTDNLPGVKQSYSTGGGKSASSTSESEVVSAAKECEDTTGEQQGVVARAASIMITPPGEAKERKSRKASFNPIARESRDKARARARERTIEKMKMRGLEKSKKGSDESNPNELEQLRSSSPIETDKSLGSSNQTNSTAKVLTEEGEQQPDRSHSSAHMIEHEMDSVSIIEKFLGISRSAPRSSSSMFNSSHNIAGSSGENSEGSYPIFTGNWDMSNDRIRYGYCAGITNIKESTGKAQEQNPSIIFMTDPNANTQDENPSANLMVNSSYAKVVSHNSDLMIPTNSNTYQGSPTCILIMPTSSDIGLQSQYQENPAHFFY